ncbi:MAG: hypothetical protein ACE368_15590 [Paracoccaceae bacterium]
MPPRTTGALSDTITSGASRDRRGAATGAPVASSARSPAPVSVTSRGAPQITSARSPNRQA